MYTYDTRHTRHCILHGKLDLIIPKGEALAVGSAEFVGFLFQLAH